MTVTDVRKDPAARTMEIVSESTAPIDRVWQVREVDPPNALEVQDGFADDHGEPALGQIDALLAA